MRAIDRLRSSGSDVELPGLTRSPCAVGSRRRHRDARPRPHPVPARRCTRDRIRIRLSRREYSARPARPLPVRRVVVLTSGLVTHHQRQRIRRDRTNGGRRNDGSGSAAHRARGCAEFRLQARGAAQRVLASPAPIPSNWSTWAASTANVFMRLPGIASTSLQVAVPIIGVRRSATRNWLRNLAQGDPRQAQAEPVVPVSSPSIRFPSGKLDPCPAGRMRQRADRVPLCRSRDQPPHRLRMTGIQHGFLGARGLELEETGCRAVSVVSRAASRAPSCAR